MQYLHKWKAQLSSRTSGYVFEIAFHIIVRDHDCLLQYFDDLPDVDPEDLGHYGGSVALADYCPYIQVRNYDERRYQNNYFSPYHLK